MEITFDHIPRFPQTPRKRRRTSNEGQVSPASPRKLKGSLEPVYNDLPLEVVSEIFEWLKPVDLHALLRTGDPDVVNFLQKGAGKGVWDVARRNIENLPTCPSVLEEWDYAALMFRNVCSTCPRIARLISWPILQRYCSECLDNPDHYTCIEDDHYTISSICKLKKAWQLLPAVVKDNMTYIPRQRLDGLCTKIREIEAIGSPEERIAEVDKLLDKLRQEMREIQAAITRLASWTHAEQIAKSLQRVELQQNRENAIIERVATTELGAQFAEFNVGGSPGFKGLKFMKRQRGLSDDEWPEIVAKIRVFLQQIEVAKTYDAAIVTMAKHYLHYIGLKDNAEPSTLPDLADLCSYALVAMIIHKCVKQEYWLPETTAQFHAALPDIIDAWQDSVICTLLGKVPDDVGAPGLEEKTLFLATVWFKARDKDYDSSRPPVMQYPGILRVRYVRPKLIKHEDLTKPEDYLHNALLPWGHPLPFLETVDKIEFAADAEEVASVVVQMAGLDPAVALQQDMDALGYRYACTCDRSRFIWTWREIIKHKCARPRSEPDGCSGHIVLLNFGDTIEIRKLESQRVEREKIGNVLSCGRCHAFQHQDDRIIGGVAHVLEHNALQHPGMTERIIAPEMKPKQLGGRQAPWNVRYNVLGGRPHKLAFTTPGLVGWAVY